MAAVPCRASAGRPPRWLLLLLPLASLWSPGSAQTEGDAANGDKDAAKGYGWVGLEREEYCRTAPTPVSQLDEKSAYPEVDHASQPNAEDRLMLKQYRGEGGLKAVIQACPMVQAATDTPGACSEEVMSYMMGLAIFAAPAEAGAVALFVWFVCCGVSVCRCCRRCCLCAERKGPRPVALWQKCTIIVVVLACSGANAIAALMAYGQTGDVSVGINDMLCQMLTTADEALNGSPQTPQFLGVEEGISRISMVRRLLDVDGRAMTDVRAILDETAAFSDAMKALEMRVKHMKDVLTAVGQHKVKEHTCWFCTSAVGNNATGDVGLLAELLLSVSQSSADAMRGILQATSASLTGRALVEVSGAVQAGGTALETFRRGYAATWVRGFGSMNGMVKTVEDARHTLFRFMCGFCVLHAALVSNLSVDLTRRSKAKYPSGTGSYVTWMCGFCAVTLALMFAGGMILIAVPVSEACHFWRHELYTDRGVGDYYRQLGLFELTSPSQAKNELSVNVWKTCFTPNGTGDVLKALDLRTKLDFQRILHGGFVELEDKMAGAVIDVAKFELLVAQATAYGGLFLLDPANPLPLEPNAASKIMGSSLDPEDAEGPDGESLVYGLNTYAGLIAGPGRFSFAHGTAGGGRIITATEPSAQEMSGELATMQNALVYARLKEQILSEDSVFRCDVMDASFRLTTRTCGFEEFRASVVSYATDVRDAGVRLGEEAQRARRIVAYDLQASVKQLMSEVKALRELFGCRFLWKRWEDFDMSLCNVALPGMINGAASWMILSLSSLVLVVLHYKMWRHLLDNKVVGSELEHFAKRYGYLSTVT